MQTFRSISVSWMNITGVSSDLYFKGITNVKWELTTLTLIRLDFLKVDLFW